MTRSNIEQQGQFSSAPVPYTHEQMVDFNARSAGALATFEFQPQETAPSPTRKDPLGPVPMPNFSHPLKQISTPPSTTAGATLKFSHKKHDKPVKPPKNPKNQTVVFVDGNSVK